MGTVLSLSCGSASGLCSPLQPLMTDCLTGSCSLLLHRLDHISHLQSLTGLRQVGQCQLEGNRHRFRVLPLHQLQSQTFHLFQIRHSQPSPHHPTCPAGDWWWCGPFGSGRIIRRSPQPQMVRAVRSTTRTANDRHGSPGPKVPGRFRRYR